MSEKLTGLHIPSTVKDTANEDGAVLLDIDRGICFSLNSVGSTIWQSLKDGCNAEQIADRLQALYTVPRDQLLQDIDQFVMQLESSRLLIKEEKPKPRGLLDLFRRQR